MYTYAFFIGVRSSLKRLAFTVIIEKVKNVIYYIFTKKNQIV